MKYEHGEITHRITKQTTVDDWLSSYHIGRKQRYTLYRDRYIKVNDQVIFQSITLEVNDNIRIHIQQETDTIVAWNHPIDIVYEDDVFLIVNKASNLLVHSDGINTMHTLCNAVKYYYDQTKQSCLVRPIHRLDIETSGLLIFSKLTFFQPMLDDLLKTKKIRREYDALVQGYFKETFSIINCGIARDRHHANKMRIDSHGKEAKTAITLRTQYQDYAYVHCRLHTGRTHQIRVHLASIKHPLLSDKLYGTMDKRIKRCALHAGFIALYHPLLEKELTITCPLPSDMLRLVK